MLPIFINGAITLHRGFTWNLGFRQNYRMSEEIIDVVNERDEVIDRKPRGEVHRLGLKHRAVHVPVFNSIGEVFLRKRSLKKDNLGTVLLLVVSRTQTGRSVIPSPRLFRISQRTYLAPPVDEKLTDKRRCDDLGDRSEDWFLLWQSE
jgi:hypothetical protein